MIITRTPFRVSFFGGGTDIPGWFNQHGGCVLSTSIDKYCYLSLRYLPPFFEFNYRIAYSKIESVKTIQQIQHKAVKAVLEIYKPDKGIEIHCDQDLPARSGIGSSSSFAVGIINAIESLNGMYNTKRDLSKKAIELECNYLNEACGHQDQYAASYGGFNFIEFKSNSEPIVNPVTITRDRLQELESSLMLFFTGIIRTSSDFTETLIKNISKTQYHLSETQKLGYQSIELLYSSNSLTEIGELLDKSWQIKRNHSSSISNSNLDNIYARAINAGALGGKLLGAGGGGFMLFFVPPDRQSKVRQELNELLEIDFKFETAGSRVIFSDL